MRDRPSRAGHRAKRSLGQNFLLDPNLQKKIVAAIRPGPDDEVVEIGPGTGALTRHLAGSVGHLVLVELDDALADRLAKEYAGNASVEVVHQNILETNLADLSSAPARLKVIGNIPYNITTPIIFHLLSMSPRPAEIVLMVQREVGDRLVAPPGDKTYGALAVGVQSVADVERVLHVARGAFRPAPDVDSVVVRINPHAPPRLDAATERSLRALARAAFGQRRKQFQRILRDRYGLSREDVERIESATGFDLSKRPESFSPLEFIALTRALGAPIL